MTEKPSMECLPGVPEAINRNRLLDGPDAEEVQGYRPTKHELEQLLNYWDSELTRELCNRMTGRPTDVQLGNYACRRLLNLTECLGIGFDQAPDGNGGLQRAWWRPPRSQVAPAAVPPEAAKQACASVDRELPFREQREAELDAKA